MHTVIRSVLCVRITLQCAWCREVEGETEARRAARVGRIAASLRNMIAAGDAETVEHVVQDLINEWPYFIHYPVAKLHLVATLIGKVLSEKVLVNRSMLISCRMILEGLKVRPSCDVCVRARLSNWA